jgi:hypothetical protein
VIPWQLIAIKFGRSSTAAAVRMPTRATRSAGRTSGARLRNN